MAGVGKTEFLGLHTWSRSDPVLCDEFNFNFSAIDRAAAGLDGRCGSCDIFSGSYSGTGDAAFQLSFPKTPKLLFVQRETNNAIYAAIVSEDTLIAGSETSSKITQNGNTLTLTAVNPKLNSLNAKSVKYNYVALGPTQ